MKTLSIFHLIGLFLFFSLILFGGNGCGCGDDDDDDSSSPADDDDSGVDDDSSDDDDDAAPQCIDEDGDTYGENCEAGPDCNDSDDSVYHWLAGYIDADDDGFPGTETLACAVDSLPAGYFDYGDDCDDENPLIHPGASEFPDDGIDQDCDTEDLQADDSNGIFVDGIAGDDGAGDGTKADPYATVAKGIAEAESAKAGLNVYITGGTYQEDLESSVSLFGGYAGDVWTRDIEANQTILTPDTSDYALTVKEASDLTLQGITFQGPSSKSVSVALFIAGEARVTLSDNQFLTGTSIVHGFGILATIGGDLINLFNSKFVLEEASADLNGLQTAASLVTVRNTTFSFGDAPSLFGMAGSSSSFDIGSVDLSLGIGTSIYGISITMGSLIADHLSVDIPDQTTGTNYGVMVSSGYADINQSQITFGDITGSGTMVGLLASSGSLWMNQSSIEIGSTPMGSIFGIIANGGCPNCHANLFQNRFLIGDAPGVMGLQLTGLLINMVNNTVVVGSGDTAMGLMSAYGGTETGFINYVNNTFSVGEGTTNQYLLAASGYPAQRIGFYNNNFDLETKVTGCLIFDGVTCVSTLNDFQTCQWRGCYQALNNIGVGPGFENQESGDLHLQDSSPLIDAGGNPLPYIRPDLADWIWYDNEGAPRPTGDGWDIGAYEYSAE